MLVYSTYPFSVLSKTRDIYFDQLHKFMLHSFSVLGNVNFHLLPASASSTCQFYLPLPVFWKKQNKKKKNKLTFFGLTIKFDKNIIVVSDCEF